MTYHAQALLAQDLDFRDRIAACAAEQNLAENPQTWADRHQWRIAAAPSFAQKYAYALDTGVEHPGRDEAVIADAEILAAVQQVQ